MKQTITNYELELLQLLYQQARQAAQLQWKCYLAIEHLLLVEEGDNVVLFGGWVKEIANSEGELTQVVGTMLDELGITVSDPLTEDNES